MKNTGREMARRDLPRFAVCIRVLPKKISKNYEKQRKGLDIPLNIRYDNQVRVVEAFFCAQTLR